MAYQLVLHADGDGRNVWPSKATLAEEAVVSPDLIAEVLDYLEVTGFVARVGWRTKQVRGAFRPNGRGA